MKRIVIGATVLILVCALLLSGCALVRKIIPEPMVHITYSADEPMTSGELAHLYGTIEQRMDAMEVKGYTIEQNLEDGVLVLHVPYSFYNSNTDKIAYEWGSRGEFAICIGEEVDGVVPMPPENTVLDNSHIASAQWMYMAVNSSEEDIEPVLSLTFTEEGAKILADVTTNLAAEKGKLYTWVDHQLIADAAVSAPITEGEAILTGFTSSQTAALYAAKINSLIPFDLTAEVDFSEIEQ